MKFSLVKNIATVHRILTTTVVSFYYQFYLFAYQMIQI